MALLVFQIPSSSLLLPLSPFNATKTFLLVLPGARVLSDLHDIFYKSSEKFHVPKICFGYPSVPFSLTEISFSAPYIDGHRGGDEETPLS